MRLKFSMVAAVVALGHAYGCSSDSSSTKKGGSGNGGDTSDSGASGASAGSSGSGGAGGAGGSAGSAGTGGTASTCAPPTNPGDAALCFTFNPENVTPETDPDFDGQGAMFFQIFGEDPPDENNPLLTQQVGTAANLADVFNLPPIRVEAGLPTTVYARAIFFDRANNTNQELVPGMWLGGFDLSGGLAQDMGLLPISAVAGQGTSVTIDLTALRQFELTVNMSVAAPGDGLGEVSFLSVSQAVVGQNTAIVGAGSRCRDISGGSATIRGVLLGSGPHHIVGVFDDYGRGSNELPPGSVTNLAFLLAGPTVPVAATFNAGTDYTPSFAVTIDTLIPFEDAGAPIDNEQCAPPGDGGASDGSMNDTGPG